MLNACQRRHIYKAGVMCIFVMFGRMIRRSNHSFFIGFSVMVLLFVHYNDVLILYLIELSISLTLKKAV